MKWFSLLDIGGRIGAIALFIGCSFLHAEEEKGILRDFDPYLHNEFMKSRHWQITAMLHMVKEELTYHDALSTAAKWRNDLAIKQKSEPVYEFGNYRKGSAFSNIMLGGGAFHTEKIDILLKKAPKTNLLRGNLQEGDLFSQYEIFGLLEGEKIPLTLVFHYHHISLANSNNLTIEDETWFKPKKKFDKNFYGESKDRQYFVIHTEAEYLDKIHDYLFDIWDTILFSDTKENKLELIAKFHWWFANAMPFERGSAAIAEVLCQVLLKSSGYDWEKKSHLLIDIEALLEPNMEEFIRKYPTYYKPHQKSAAKFT
jgi:hypothetical protein